MGSPDTEPGGRRRLLAVGLAGVAGFVDAAGFLILDLFPAHMSGNTARLGAYGGHGWYLRAAPSGFAVAVFVISVAAGTVLMEAGSRARRRSPAALVLVIEIALLGLFTALGALVVPRPLSRASPAHTYYPVAALLVAAMGLQTSTLQRISGRTVRTTYVTGMLTNLAEEVVGWIYPPPADRSTPPSYLQGELGINPGRPSLRRIGLIVGIWTTYAAAALLGGYLELRWHLSSLLVPVGLLIAALSAELRWPIERVGQRTPPRTPA